MRADPAEFVGVPTVDRSGSPSVAIRALEAEHETERRARERIVKRDEEAMHAQLEQRLIAHRGKHEHLRHISKSFTEIDTDGDGRVSLDELRNHGPPPSGEITHEDSQRFAAELFDESDLDADGMLTLHEIHKALDGLHADLDRLVRITSTNTIAKAALPRANVAAGVDRRVAADRHEGHRESMHGAADGVLSAIAFSDGAASVPSTLSGASVSPHRRAVAASTSSSPSSSSPSSHGRGHPLYRWIRGGSAKVYPTGWKGSPKRTLVGSTHRPSQRWSDWAEESKSQKFAAAEEAALPVMQRCELKCTKRLERKKYEFYRLMQNKTDQVAAVLLIFAAVIIGGGGLIFIFATIVNAVPSDNVKWWPRPATCNGDGANAECVSAEPEVYAVWDDFGSTVHNFFEALWNAWLFVADPGTHAEFSNNYILRFFAMSQSIAGIILFTIILALFVEYITRLMNDLREGKSVVVEEHHVLIINWTDKSFTLIEQLCRSMEGDLEEAALHERCRGWCLCGRAPRRHCIVLMADRTSMTLEEVTVRYNEARNGAMADKEVRDVLQPRVCCRRVMPVDIVLRAGNPCVGTDLEHFGAAHTAAAIVVLAGSGNADEADAKTLRIVLALKSLSKQKVSGHIVAEVRDIDNSELIQLVGGESVITLTTHDVLGRLMIKCGRTPELTRVFQEIFGFKGDEFYESCALKDSPVMSVLIGRRFGDVLHLFTDAIPIGVYDANAIAAPAVATDLTQAQSMRMRSPGSALGGGDEEEFKIRLKPDDDYILKPEDRIVVIAEDQRWIDTPPAMMPPRLLRGPEHAPLVGTRLRLMPEKIMICGWRRDLQDVIDQLDQLVPAGSELHLMCEVPTMQRNAKFLEGGLDTATLKNLRIVHWQVNTSVKRQWDEEMERHPIEEFDSIMILADEQYEADAMQADSHSVATLMLLRACKEEREEALRAAGGRPKRRSTSSRVGASSRSGALSAIASDMGISTITEGVEFGEEGDGARQLSDDRSACERFETSAASVFIGKKLNIVCEILDSRTRDILEQNSEVKGKAEYIHSNVIVSKVMAQIAEEPTIHDIMKQFLDSNGKEIFVRPGSMYCSGPEERINFWEMSTRVRRQGDILLGYCRTELVDPGASEKQSSLGLLGLVSKRNYRGSSRKFSIAGSASVEWEEEIKITINPKGAKKEERLEYASDSHQIIVLSEQQYDDGEMPRMLLRSPNKRRHLQKKRSMVQLGMSPAEADATLARDKAAGIEAKSTAVVDITSVEATGLRTEIAALKELLGSCLAELKS